MRMAMTMLVAGLLLAASQAVAGETLVVVQSRTVDYKIGDQAFEGLFVHPRGAKGKVPGVLMVHNWLGVSGETRKQAERMARLGLAVFAVDVYGKGIRAKGPQDASALAGKYKGDRALLRSRVAAGLDALRASGLADAKRIAAIGYCFGGTAVLELARSGADIAGVVSFHGGLDSPSPADGKNIRAKVLVLHGADDPYVPAKDIAAFQQELRDAKVDWQMVYYAGAVHSFTHKEAGSDPSKGAAYDERADRRSWQAMLTFFQEVL